MDPKAIEINFDGLVGPTHNYSGLSYGNVASIENQLAPSNPREAALQGLEKMKFLADLGVVQAVLPPHERPHMPTLRALGFEGSDETILQLVRKTAPTLLQEVSSAAAMWTANAATICPSADSMDGKVHITPANLTSKFHRSIEAQTTSEVLKAIFANPAYFIHHPPLIPNALLADEGAANHTRFCKEYGHTGVQLFVYGRSTLHPTPATPKHYPARQTLEACQAISRLHRLNPERVIYAQQHPNAIDGGAFHNDVVSVGNRSLFLFHEQAFVHGSQLIKALNQAMTDHCGAPLFPIEVKATDVSLTEAVASYLFNSQLISLPGDRTLLLAPHECRDNPKIRAYIETLTTLPKRPISQALYFDLRQSMRNGGGPACLRLRIVLTQEERKAVKAGVFLDEMLYHRLKAWIMKHYRDRLHPDDLADPQLLQDSRYALDELTNILGIGAVFSFQKREN